MGEGSGTKIALIFNENYIILISPIRPIVNQGLVKFRVASAKVSVGAIIPSLLVVDQIDAEVRASVGVDYESLKKN